ncbi:hypothetical protein A2V61_03370 [Candidatus Woesebacteria bacterium RBG_19FT_COMBO_47_8]|uniref:ABC transporter permease n=1 Tax=Candidatus Woesebacteria bacterium RBG_13_46_13 TaxID=1802479 RepID=A0A1F7X7G6_9BACT|nr:MAG: hypothetical protein A2Y68_02510 [Candidatus Woesebacteria bacterium RBG_13_46_13]OGM16724.1 MAG: hypothetical protein A2V61_03370 [Candidatus Woesebacteria bacterium RBG_19FT_COMBO_47_8]HJX59128.1 ABC-2 family transporter protein [Patescibacteria group bacterium]
MKKYLAIFKISFAQEFAYRLNFIMWRLRNVMQIFLIFFLWNAVFTDPTRVVFGYDRGKILTYVFGILIMKAIVLSARTIEVAGEISSGDLTNFLLKPVNYFKYWFSRDLSSKALNLGFAASEALILYLILRPPFFLQTNPWLIVAFVISLAIAVVLFFGLLFLSNLIAFWMPEQGWSAQFLIIVIFTDFLSGGVFPLDIFPLVVQKILYTLPFPYLLFFPLQIYLGKIPVTQVWGGIMIACAWTLILLAGLKFVWNRGIRKYEAVGR